MLVSILCVAAGGAAGSVMRYLVSTGAAALWGREGIGTILVNLLGSLLIGFLAARSGKAALGPELRLLLMTGFLGGFTTFSTYSLDVVRAVMDAQALRGGLYWAIGAIGGPLLAFAGVGLGERLR